jgi:hypothetical protein
MQAKHLITLILLSASSYVGAQTLTSETKARIEDRLNQELTSQRIAVGKAKIDSVAQEKKVLKLFMNSNFSYLPFREDNVRSLYSDIRALLPPEYSKYKLQLHANNRLIEQLIPAYTKTQKGKQKEKVWAPNASQPLVKPLDRPFTPTAGLQNRHIAMWQSHGRYFEQKLNRWEWQRARILQTVEDLYTQSYVLPFLVPMLENAGANVLLPRERDTRREELIIDNDGKTDGTYSETNGLKAWTEGKGEGFAHVKTEYRDWDNPFRDGTFRQTTTIKKGAESTAKWTPSIPVTGEYAVYVSYKSLKNSTNDALYTVNHAGGTTSFHVNQQMGGGTWIYLGTFQFNKGTAGSVTLSNVSAKAGQILTSDGIKIGGGMGNIARSLNVKGTTENLRSSDPVANTAGGSGKDAEMLPFEPDYQLSGYPRYTEGARYWLQWAGAPDSVYSESRGKNDYTDDYKCRGLWVNWLAGGSQALPKRKGLNIPIDMSMAFHSDAGTTLNDSIVGTLIIYMTNTEGRETYANGASRYLAHDLADLIQSQIVSDVRKLHAPEWSRRGKWNSSYFEARVPEVPAILLELLSHQNFADMRYGLDPRFRFTVSRAIYKGILRFISSQRNAEYVVQPLPVDHLMLNLKNGNTAELQWKAVKDELEETATPDGYIVYTRVGDGGWDNGVLVHGTSYSATLEKGKIYSWKVAAVNKGGKSFDSEILSAGLAGEGKPVLVVNGFDRISAPADFVAPGEAGKELAGFLDDVDHGVPYLKDILYTGQMKEYRRNIPWMDDDASGFGDSYADYEDKVIAGNTFDYPKVHGASLMANGYSFISCSNECVEEGLISLKDYEIVDLILGKQYQSKMGKGGTFPLQFKTFNEPMQKALTEYLQKDKGKLFVSGAYVASDLWDNPLAEKKEADVKFATDVLKFQWRVNQAAKHSGLKTVQSALSKTGERYDYYDTLNEECYVVESPDALEPSCPEAQTVLRYTENNLSAGVAYKKDYSTYIMGVPFETIRTEAGRNALMKTIINTLK